MQADFIQMVLNGGTGVASAVITVYYMIRLLSKDVASLKQSCEECRSDMRRRLDAGDDEFSGLKDLANRTQLDILKTVQTVADKTADYRDRAGQEFVREATFKDRVLAHMMTSCPNCRKGGAS